MSMMIYWLAGLVLLFTTVIFYIYKMRMLCICFTLFLMVVFLSGGVFIVNEGSQVVITQFGRIIGKPYTQAGLYLKVPYIWKANHLDKRIFSEIEHQPNIATKDGYLLKLHMVFLWKITHANVYIDSVDNIDEAKILLKNMVSGAVRQVIAMHNLLETVQNVQPLEVSAAGQRSPLANGLAVEMPGSDIILSLYENSFKGRNQLVHDALQKANKYAKEIGIKIEAILITNILFSTAVGDMMQERMVLERLRHAAHLRSTGMAEAQNIHGLIALKYQSIIAPAEKEALIINGKARAYMTKIKANAYGKNRKFYNYWRTLQAYKNSLSKKNNNLIMSTDLPFLNFMSSQHRYIARPNAKDLLNNSGDK